MRRCCNTCGNCSRRARTGLLDRNKLRRSLQALYATGRFADLQVEADRVGRDQLSLVFIARQNYFIGTVTVEGSPKRPNSNQLVNASKLQLGELYTSDKIERAIRSMKAILADNGYYRGAVSVDEQFHPPTQQVDVRFQVRADGAARVGEVTVVGQAGLSPEQVRKVAHIHEGDTVSANRTTGALQRLRKRYQKNGRLEAQLAITSRVYDPQNNTLNYVFHVDRGPTVEIDVKGAKLSRGKLKKLVPVFEEGAVDDDLLNEGLAQHSRLFPDVGLLDVTVRWEKTFVAVENRMRVLYLVDTGMRHKLESGASRATDSSAMR